MITLLGSLIGFLGSMVPDLFKLFQEHQDRAHERAILHMQLEQQKAGHSERLEAIAARADIVESRALYATWRSNIAWVDALNGSVRPVLAYGFFLFYVGVKCAQIALLDWQNPLPWHIAALWSAEDQAIFAGIISFYFGQRAMGKIRGGQ